MRLPVPVFLLASLGTVAPPVEATPPSVQAEVEVVLEGKGFGHGVGMAQDGAYTMGVAGASAAEILSTFYPGTSIGSRGGTVRVDLLESPTSSVVIGFPGGGEVLESGGRSAGFPIAVSTGGSVRLSFEGGRYVASPLAGATAAPGLEPDGAAGGQEEAQRSPEVPTPPTTASLLGLIPLPAPTTAPPTTATTTPPEEEAAPTESAEPTSGSALRAVPTEGTTVAVGDRRYRGSLQAVAAGGGLQLVNELDVEEYLLGMGEVMDPGWPAGGLQAQAIAARTYALDAMAAGQGLCSTQQCQVYLGQTAEYAAMNRAVAATSSQVLTYGGALAEAVYSANGGGISATPEEGFGQTQSQYPYLQPVTYPTHDPQPWEKRLSLAELAARTGYAGQASDVTVSKVGPSGRALEVTVTGDAGARTVDGRGFASTLGLRSTLFTLKVERPAGSSPGPRSRPTPRRLTPPPNVLTYGDVGTETLGRLPWTALALLLLVTWGIAAQRYRTST